MSVSHRTHRFDRSAARTPARCSRARRWLVIWGSTRVTTQNLSRSCRTDMARAGPAPDRAAPFRALPRRAWILVRDAAKTEAPRRRSVAEASSVRTPASAGSAQTAPEAEAAEGRLRNHGHQDFENLFDGDECRLRSRSERRDFWSRSARRSFCSACCPLAARQAPALARTQARTGRDVTSLAPAPRSCTSRRAPVTCSPSARPRAPQFRGGGQGPRPGRARSHEPRPCPRRFVRSGPETCAFGEGQVLDADRRRRPVTID